jgi:hypothetical protein
MQGKVKNDYKFIVRNEKSILIVHFLWVFFSKIVLEINETEFIVRQCFSEPIKVAARSKA